MPGCSVLLEFAHEQLARAHAQTLNFSRFTMLQQRKATGMLVCVVNGSVFYQESHAKHMWHGEADRAFGMLSVVWQWLRRTGWSGPPRCFQLSGRDDQIYQSGLHLPTMLFHRGRYQHQTEGDSYFLWPEHNFEGELTRSQPPTRTFRKQTAEAAKPWSERLPLLRFRGSPIHTTRQTILSCATRSKDAEVREFYANHTDISSVRISSVQGDVNRSLQQHGMDAFHSFQHVLWLPGGNDWSSSLNSLMALGSTLYMPGDLHESHSLNTYLLLERCSHCVVAFNRSVDSCKALATAFEWAQEQGRARKAAARLASFVNDEVSPDCMDAYMSTILAGLPQTVLEIDAIPRVNIVMGEGWPWREFSCDWQRELVGKVVQWAKGSGGSSAHQSLGSFTRWWNQSTCANDVEEQQQYIPVAAAAQNLRHAAKRGGATSTSADTASDFSDSDTTEPVHKQAT